jgi:hypothetical protein
MSRLPLVPACIDAAVASPEPIHAADRLGRDHDWRGPITLDRWRVDISGRQVQSGPWGACRSVDQGHLGGWQIYDCGRRIGRELVGGIWLMGVAVEAIGYGRLIGIESARRTIVVVTRHWIIDAVRPAPIVSNSAVARDGQRTCRRYNESNGRAPHDGSPSWVRHEVGVNGRCSPSGVYRRGAIGGMPRGRLYQAGQGGA